MDYIVQSQHNQKCPLISKDISFLKGGQFAPAETDHFGRQKVVNLLRRRLDILSGVSSYADDFVVTCSKSEYLEQEIKPMISKFLADRGLELSQEKTKITHIQQGFDFLGFNIRKYNGKCLTKPKKDSVKNIYSSISECVTNHKTVTQEQLIRMITPKIRGWANFFRHSAAKHTFSLLDNKVFKLLWIWAKRRHPNKGSHWIKAKYFKNKGNQHWVFSTTDNKRSCELPLFDATKIIRHTKIKCHSNPYDKDWESYFKEREKGKRAKHENISKLATVN